MAYLMEASLEAERLELQEKIHAYKIQHDLTHFKIKDGDIILDAGCGGGTVTRFLYTHYPLSEIHGCDMSPERVNQARALSQGTSLNFFHSPMEEINASTNSYDKIVCRFVYEYIVDPLIATKELFRICKPGGQVCLIDLDGILYNIHTSNTELLGLLKEVENGFSTKFHIDLYVGRKLYSYLEDAGFKNITYSIRTLEFQGEDLVHERDNYRVRFDNGRPIYEKILGKERAQRFFDLYLDEMMNPRNIVFCNNFSVIGEK